MDSNYTPHVMSKEAAERFKQSERARWAAAQPQKIVGTFKPVLSAQEQRQAEEYAAKHNLPF